MSKLKQNMRLLSIVLVSMFALTILSAAIGHFIFTYYFKPDFDRFKEEIIYNNQVIQNKPFRMMM